MNHHRIILASDKEFSAPLSDVLASRAARVNSVFTHRTSKGRPVKPHPAGIEDAASHKARETQAQ